MVKRSTSAGVTLVEMLVVLAIFAVVSGAVVMGLPTRQTQASAEIVATSVAGRLDWAAQIALTSGRGFGVEVEDRAIRFLQRAPDDSWRPHPDPALAEVKLFATRVRMVKQDQASRQIFAVSPALVPQGQRALRLEFGEGAAPVAVYFDGVVARLETGG